MTENIEQGRRHEDTLLTRHWPAFLLTLSVIVLVIAWVLLAGDDTQTDRSSVRGLVESTIPNLLTVVVVALLLYILLKIDVTRPRIPIGLRTSTEQTQELEAIEQKLSTIVTAVNLPALRPRSQLASLDTLLENAHDVTVVVTSGLGLVNHHYGLFQDVVDRNVALRVVLLDPNVTEAMTIWDRQSNPPMSHPEDDICQGIRLFRQIEEQNKLCRVLLTDVVLPFSLVCAFDGNGGGVIQAEFNLFQAATDRRPHVLVASSDGSPWFTLFREQAEACVRRAEEHEAAGTRPASGHT